MIVMESQCCFLQHLCNINLIFMVRKTIKYKRDLFIVYVELVKAFDTMNRDILWSTLTKCGCHSKFMVVLKEFHTGMSAPVITGCLVSEPYEVSVGVRQDCVLAPDTF